MSQSKFTVRTMAIVGLLAALVFAASKMSITIPTPTQDTRLHMGNVMCLLSGMVLGPFYGGLAAGIGSMFYDFTDPRYVTSAPFTFAFKFLMAFVCGLIVRYGEKHKIPWSICWAASISGALTYVALYLSKNLITDLFFLRVEMETAMISLKLRMVTSSVNGVIAAVASVPLFFAVKQALRLSHIPLPGRPQDPGPGDGVSNIT